MKSPLRRIAKKTSSYQPKLKPNKTSPKMFILVLIIAGAGMMMQVHWVQKNKDKFVSTHSQAGFQTARKAESMAILCNYCDGSGILEQKDENEAHLFCPICFGKGRKDIRVMQDREMVCSQCYGMGRLLLNGEPTTCGKCKNWGIVITESAKMHNDKTIEYYDIDCDLCMRAGLINHPTQRGKLRCPPCAGVGWNVARKRDSSDVPCPACGGMGQQYDKKTLENFTCARCSGWGLITTGKKTQNAGL